ncbi:MAG TPA: N-acetyltransferase [Nocardioides sp.]|uniref:GNAT family N-acetyltransferase n=1 Tax=Nocardioides sp. TaxID=35761 RepID=UPI002F3F998B
MAFEVRPEQPVDRDDVLRVIAAAFGDGGREEHGLQVADIWASLGRHRRAGLVVEQGGHVLGHVGLSSAWVDARRLLVEVWVLSPLSVLPERQGQGIGTALVEAAVGTARRSGVPALFLEGSPDYYGTRGFERADRHGFLPAALERTPRPAFQCVLFEGHEEWMAGQLIYPAVWWEHDAAGLRDPRLAEVEERLRSASAESIES